MKRTVWSKSKNNLRLNTGYISSFDIPVLLSTFVVMSLTNPCNRNDDGDDSLIVYKHKSVLLYFILTITFLVLSLSYTSLHVFSKNFGIKTNKTKMNYIVQTNFKNRGMILFNVNFNLLIF